MGAVDDYDVAMMVHLFNVNQLCTKLIAIDTYTYSFHGRVAHVFIHPWEGDNAFNDSQFMFHAIDMLRLHVPIDTRIHGLIRT